MKTDVGFENDKAAHEAERALSARKPSEHFCPTCGRIIDKAQTLCDYCLGKEA